MVFSFNYEADAFFGSPQVRLQGCTFNNNTLSTLPMLLADNSNADVGDEAAFYSDSTTPKVCTYPFVAGEDPEAVPEECDNTNPKALGSIRSFETQFMAEVLTVRVSCVHLS